MKTGPRSLLAAGVFLLTGGFASGQKQAQTLKPGDPIRKAIFNELRPAFEKDLKQKVIFQVNYIKMQNGWVFLTGKPLQPTQKPINYKKTKYREAIENGAFDDGFTALLHKTGRVWSIVESNIGATDVVWEGWEQQYHAPAAIFPYSRDAKGETHRH